MECLHFFSSFCKNKETILTENNLHYVTIKHSHLCRACMPKLCLKQYNIWTGIGWPSHLPNTRRFALDAKSEGKKIKWKHWTSKVAETKSSSEELRNQVDSFGQCIKPKTKTYSEKCYHWYWLLEGCWTRELCEKHMSGHRIGLHEWCHQDILLKITPSPTSEEPKAEEKVIKLTKPTWKIL